MPYQIIRQDITKMQVDAIVNPTDEYFTGLGGTDGRIHSAAGPELREACDALPSLEEGHVAVTKAFQLPCKYIIHTFGPIWRGGINDERKKLKSCYYNALTAAKSLGCETIAFPLISSGTFGYPKDKVLRVALETISSFLMRNDMMVYILVYDKKAFELSKKLQKDVAEYIDENYVSSHRRRRYDPRLDKNEVQERSEIDRSTVHAVPERGEPKPRPTDSLDQMLSGMDETFSEMLLRLIASSGMTNAECYKRANLDKKHFSKIISDKNYQPKKQTVLALAVALELSLEDTKVLLGKAGLALTNSNRFDVIVQFFINRKIYKISEINEVLYQYDQKLLGNALA